MTPHSPQNPTSTTLINPRTRWFLDISRWAISKIQRCIFCVPCPYKTADGALVPHPHRKHCAPARVFRPPRPHPLAPAAVQRHRSSRRGGAALAGCPTEECEPGHSRCSGVLQLQSGTFVCNWALGQCDRMPPQVLLAFQDALAGDATVSFVFEVVQA